MPAPFSPRDDALAIWQAGVEAVKGERLIADCVRIEGDWLCLADEELRLSSIGRIVVVGAGKAGAGMAAGLEAALGDRVLREKRVAGWVNVPADCARPLQAIHLHAARPAGVNEPTAEGIAGTKRILQLVGNLAANDLCICLISGGGSALLPAPVEGISLDDKLEITRKLGAAGANIRELNAVRSQLSRVKGGGLARACRAGRLVSFILSDVPGDDLEFIASGPTVEASCTAADALEILRRYESKAGTFPVAALEYLKNAVARTAANQAEGGKQPRDRLPACHSPADRLEAYPTEIGGGIDPARVANVVIGNNAAAVDAAGMEAERRGYNHAMQCALAVEGEANDVGRKHAALVWSMLHGGAADPNCLVTGGEPVVTLPAEGKRGRGGRNQQLALAALVELLRLASDSPEALQNVAFLSGGTDGEDGPTDAAGAVVDYEVITRMESLKLDPQDFLNRCDAYTFFEATGGLIKTGPTHTNVGDVRVAVVRRDSADR